MLYLYNKFSYFFLVLIMFYIKIKSGSWEIVEFGLDEVKFSGLGGESVALSVAKSRNIEIKRVEFNQAA